MISLIPKLRHTITRRHCSASYFLYSSQKKTQRESGISKARLQFTPSKVSSPRNNPFQFLEGPSQVSFSSLAGAFTKTLDPDMAEEGSQEFHRLPTTVKPTNYALTLTPDLKKFTFEGSQDVKLEVGTRGRSPSTCIL